MDVILEGASVVSHALTFSIKTFDHSEMHILFLLDEIHDLSLLFQNQVFFLIVLFLELRVRCL